MPASPPPGLIISAASSGAGKTTITVGILRALRRRGLRTGSAKCGPDFIDPGLHELATGRPSMNLDSWTMRGDLMHRIRAYVEDSVDVVVCEGVMGLFDGRPEDGVGMDGSTADIATHMKWPVVLVLDAGGQAQSAAAVALGFAQYRPSVEVAAVLLNRVGSERHAKLCRDAIERIGIPVIGALPRGEPMKLPSRHLGLVQAAELENAESFVEAVARTVEQHVDLDVLLAIARPGSDSVHRQRAAPLFTPPGQVIALARDHAFSFLYPHLLAEWRSAGAEVRLFSPLADERPDPSADVCWLPGGYPELHAGRLAGNRVFLDGLRAFAASKPVHGECGGYMVLGEVIRDQAGVPHRMSGLLGHETSFERRKVHLGYRAAKLGRASVLGPAGSWCRGHEFHYSTSTPSADDEPLFERVLGAADGCLGTRRGSISGSYFHLVDVASTERGGGLPAGDREVTRASFVPALENP